MDWNSKSFSLVFLVRAYLFIRECWVGAQIGAELEKGLS